MYIPCKQIRTRPVCFYSMQQKITNTKQFAKFTDYHHLLRSLKTGSEKFNRCQLSPPHYFSQPQSSVLFALRSFSARSCNNFIASISCVCIRRFWRKSRPHSMMPVALIIETKIRPINLPSTIVFLFVPLLVTAETLFLNIFRSLF